MDGRMDSSGQNQGKAKQVFRACALKTAENGNREFPRVMDDARFSEYRRLHGMDFEQDAHSETSRKRDSPL